MIGGKTRRPRNVDSLRAAAILYGDWGTSKAYVLGLAFALAGYSSFWLIAAMSVLLALVGINYMILFLMSRDGEMPRGFQILNNFGVPNLGLIVATIIPALMVVAIPDVAGLADLYAVGVVGAIATNLGATSTDAKLDLLVWERVPMFCTFIIVLAIELTLFVNKPGVPECLLGRLSLSVCSCTQFQESCRNERPSQRLKNERQRNRCNRAQNF
jgi:hypothetical protein